MKKAYGISFLLVILIAIGAYQISYQFAQKKFQEQAEANSKTDSQNEIVQTDTNKENVITSDTKYIVQVYDKTDTKIEEKEVEMPQIFIGNTRDELLDVLEDAQLVSFSSERIIVKTQAIEEESFEYYLKEENGYITVLLADKETVYSNTDIKVSSLPEDIQEEIECLKPIKDLNQLYSFLETYSS